MTDERMAELMAEADMPNRDKDKFEELQRVEESAYFCEYTAARMMLSELEPSSKAYAKYMNKRSEIEALWDQNKAIFVYNLGWLLSQTSCGVDSLILIDENTVRVIFSGPMGDMSHHDVNINMDGYEAIIRDVMKCL